MTYSNVMLVFHYRLARPSTHTHNHASVSNVSVLLQALQVCVCKQYEFQPFMAADVEREVPKNKSCVYNIKIVWCM